MSNKITITVSGPTKSGKTSLAALFAWALRKFNVTPIYTGKDRPQWMGLVGDEMTLSKVVADIVNGNLFPLVEVIEVNEPKVTVSVEVYEAVVAERDALKAELEQVKQEIVAPAPAKSEGPVAEMLPGELSKHDPGDGTHG